MTLRQSRRNRLPPLAALVLGLALISLAIPRTVGAWFSLEVQSPFEKLLTGKSTTPGELTGAAAGLRRAVAWAPSARALTDLAAVEIVQAEALAPQQPERAALLADAEKHLVEGLGVSPLDSFNWLRLATVRELRGESPRQIALALMQSLDMGPNYRALWIPRTRMLLRYWRALNEDEFMALRGQLRTIWRTPAYRQQLIDAAVDLNGMGLVAAAAGDDPDSAAALKRLEAQLVEASPHPAQSK